MPLSLAPHWAPCLDEVAMVILMFYPLITTIKNRQLKLHVATDKAQFSLH